MRLLTMMPLAALAAVLVMTSYVKGQAAPSGRSKVQAAPIRQPQMLQVTSTRALATRAFGFYGVPLSDESGNLYFSAVSGIFKLSQLKESDSKMIQTPPDRSGADDSGLDALVDYAVTPSGALFMLAGDARGQHHIFNFNSDGNVMHDTKLETPVDVLIVNFAVFDNETILATGFYDRTAPENIRGKSYAAIFDQTGQVLKDLTRGVSLDAVQVSSASEAPVVNSTYIRPGKDGNLYLLKPAAVLVISPGGEIVRLIKFAKPDPSSAAIGLRVADGLISIDLGDEPGEGVHPSPKYLVLDATTGKEYGYYAKPAEVKGRLVNFSRDEGFLFVTDEKGTFKLISAKMN